MCEILGHVPSALPSDDLLRLEALSLSSKFKQLSSSLLPVLMAERDWGETHWYQITTICLIISSPSFIVISVLCCLLDLQCLQVSPTAGFLNCGMMKNHSSSLISVVFLNGNCACILTIDKNDFPTS